MGLVIALAPDAVSSVGQGHFVIANPEFGLKWPAR
jgi:hypothetical protein